MPELLLLSLPTEMLCQIIQGNLRDKDLYNVRLTCRSLVPFGCSIFRNLVVMFNTVDPLTGGRLCTPRLLFDSGIYQHVRFIRFKVTENAERHHIADAFKGRNFLLFMRRMPRLNVISVDLGNNEVQLNNLTDLCKGSASLMDCLHKFIVKDARAAVPLLNHSLRQVTIQTAFSAGDPDKLAALFSNTRTEIEVAFLQALPGRCLQDPSRYYYYPHVRVSSRIRIDEHNRNCRNQESSTPHHRVEIQGDENNASAELAGPIIPFLPTAWIHTLRSFSLISFRLRSPQVIDLFVTFLLERRHTLKELTITALTIGPSCSERGACSEMRRQGCPYGISSYGPLIFDRLCGVSDGDGLRLNTCVLKCLASHIQKYWHMVDKATVEVWCKTMVGALPPKAESPEYPSDRSDSEDEDEEDSCASVGGGEEEVMADGDGDEMVGWN